MDHSLNRRIKFAQLGLLLPLGLVFVQLARFQVLPTADRQALDEAPYALTQHIETPRGRILDRGGRLLAGNDSKYRVYLDSCQYHLYMEKFGGLAEGSGSSLSDVLSAVARASGAEIDIPDVVDMLRRVDERLQAEYGQPLSTCTLIAGTTADSEGEQLAIPLWLTEEQNFGLEVAQGLRADSTGTFHSASVLLYNVRTEAWYFRKYPEGGLASEVIGYSRQEGSGLGSSADGVVRYYREIGDWGVERFYNDILQGAREDVSWTVVPVEITSNLDRAQPPADLVLTIDRDIQAEAEAALVRGIRAGEALRGSILVLNPKTGEILAMADYPAVDLREPEDFLDIFRTKGRQPIDPEGQVVSLNVAAPYEPGSTFKVLTMAAALDVGAVQPNTWFWDTGRIEIGGVVIHNWQKGGFGAQDMTGCLRHSINTCLAWVATQLGAGPFYEYMDRFRIGRLTGVDMAPEISGVLRRPGDQSWTDSTLATNAFGQGVSATTLQMAVAVSAVANGGVMMTPHVVRQIILPDGRVHTVAPVPLGQPISAATAATLSEMLATSLEQESSRALVEGYRIAGKTGTADIPPYVTTKTVASFVGWGPVDDPQILVYVRIDEPTSADDRHYGSITAAPVFADLAARVFTLLGIPPDNVRLTLSPGG
ncbi:MAG: penicillin-binding protein 2 [Anaerolineales bacterium]|nr:penicillin-binding protein 2 [Anaerolineales bacterium]